MKTYDKTGHYFHGLDVSAKYATASYPLISEKTLSEIVDDYFKNDDHSIELVLAINKDGFIEIHDGHNQKDFIVTDKPQELKESPVFLNALANEYREDKNHVSGGDYNTLSSIVPNASGVSDDEENQTESEENENQTESEENENQTENGDNENETENEENEEDESDESDGWDD